MKHQVNLKVDGNPYKLSVEPWKTLLDLLRDELKLTSVKEGCSVGECGTCAVIMDGKTVNSCLVLALDADGKEIVTPQATATKAEFRSLQEAFVDRGAFQCRFSPAGTQERQEFITFCHLCCGHCSVKMVVEGGKIVDLAPDTVSGLPNEMCPVKKGRLAIPEILSHRDRLLYPLHRVGARGEGKWERISWDQALDGIAQKLKELKEKYGPESVALGLGEPKGMEFAFAQRFASTFGTPNVSTPGWSCGIFGVASQFTFGSVCIPDEENLPHLLVIWGQNINHTSGSMRRERITATLEKGGKLIVVDPKKIDLASAADLWIKPRPGSDGVLAMGLLKVVVEEKLYDQDIVANWTVGFEQLQQEVSTFSLEDVERLTWVPRQQIEAMARLYTQVKPAAIAWGNALDQVVNAFQACRAIAILKAITGNVNVPGGDVFLTPPPFTRPGRFFLLSKFPRLAEKTAGGEFKLALKAAFIPAMSLLKAILEEKPYPIKAALFILTNPLISYPDSEATYQALMKLDLSVVFELFMTPTAALADYVLPVATGGEHDALGYWPGWYEQMRAHPKLVDPPGECHSDTWIINELAKRLGLGEHFWDDDAQAMDLMLQPSGFTYEEFKQKRVLSPKREYKKHDYKTPSGKMEIYSKQLQEMGYSPLPRWQEISQLPEPQEDYPLLLTNAKEESYVLSSYKSVAALRLMKPDPIVELNPETAQKAGLKEGEWVYIETKKGRMKQKLVLNPYLDPRIVMASFGWWFPEEPSTVYGWRKANINILTGDEPADPTTGSIQLRGLPCRVYKDGD